MEAPLPECRKQPGQCVHPQNVPEVAVGTLTLQRWIPKLREVT